MKVIGIVKEYCATSGQSLSSSKCQFFLPANAPRQRVHVVKGVTGFARGTFPFVYLGVPVGPGKRQVRHFQHIIDCIVERTNSWQMKLLSSAGRLVLIKHVLASMPIHVLSATSIPEGCIKKIEAIVAKFFWGSTTYGRRCHSCKWDAICLPVEEGGLVFATCRTFGKHSY